MPRSHFFQLLQAIHLNDNETATKKGDLGYDPLHKLRLLIIELQQNFCKIYKPSDCHSIDESMVLFKGRKSFKQYMPLKPIKRGFKVWMRADPTTGFASQFEVYTGKEEEAGSLGSRVVKKFTETSKEKRCLAVFDNFFTSEQIMQDLYDDGIFAVGTVRAQRRGLPDNLKNKKKMKPEQHTFQVKKNVVAIQWQDKKLTNLLTTAHDPRETITVQKKQKDGTKNDTSCPKAVVDYTKYMRGVDRFDQMKEYYSVSRRSKKWWMVSLLLHDRLLPCKQAIYVTRSHLPRTTSLTSTSCWHWRAH